MCEQKKGERVNHTLRILHGNFKGETSWKMGRGKNEKKRWGEKNASGRIKRCIRVGGVQIQIKMHFYTTR